MTNTELYRKAVDAINELFDDKSVSISECRENLQELQDEIDVMLDALDCDKEVY